MSALVPNPRDLEIWDGLFADVPPAWRIAPPSAAMQACASWLSDVGVRSVLDLGCGVGRWTVWLHREGFATAGSDFAPNAIKYARQWAADERRSIPFVCQPITELPFPGVRFDAVVGALVFDLVSPAELDKGLEVVRRSLGAEGFLFAVFNPVLRPVEDGSMPNPTAGVTLVRYSDDDLNSRLAEHRFVLLRSERFELDTRAFLWQLAPDAG